MKKKFYKIVCVLGLISVISLTSCENYLEQSPYGKVTQETLATKAGINGLLNGAYAMLDGADGFDWLSSSSNWVLSNMASHEGVRGGTSFPEIAEIENHTVSAASCTRPLAVWKGEYTAVQRANDVLRLLPLIPSNELTTNEAIQIKAEATFLRAVAYWELARIFLNVPWVDESVTFDEGNFVVPNTESIWPHLESDFKFAANSLAETKSDVGRPNKWAAEAFLAKVYMQQNKYSEALSLLTDCINNGVTSNGKKYALGKFSDNFNANTENGSESVFAIQFCVNDGSLGANANQGDMAFMPFVPQCSGGGTGFVTFDCVNAFKTDPETGLPLFDTYDDFNIKNDMGLTNDDPFTPYTGTLDPRLDHTVGRRGIPLLDWGLFRVDWVYDQANRGPYAWVKSFFWKKDFGTNTENYQGWDNISNVNYNMIRFADILLLAAECEVEIGSLAKAEEYVNMVRTRAADPTDWVKTYIDNDDPSSGFTNTPAANYFIGLYKGQFTANGQVYARKAVRFERRLELALEGHRFFDLQRWNNKDAGYMANEINRIIAHENTCPARFDNLDGAVFMKGKNELYPIPQTEIDLMVKDGKSVLTQNPGY